MTSLPQNSDLSYISDGNQLSQTWIENQGLLKVYNHYPPGGLAQSLKVVMSMSSPYGYNYVFPWSVLCFPQTLSSIDPSPALWIRESLWSWEKGASHLPECRAMSVPSTQVLPHAISLSPFLELRAVTAYPQAPCLPVVLGSFCLACFGPSQAWEPPWTVSITTLSPGPLPKPYHISWSCMILSCLYHVSTPLQPQSLNKNTSSLPARVEDHLRGPSWISVWVKWRYPWLEHSAALGHGVPCLGCHL